MPATIHTAKEIAAELGRDWNDCGEYERQSFADEAERRAPDCSHARVSWPLESERHAKYVADLSPEAARDITIARLANVQVGVDIGLEVLECDIDKPLGPEMRRWVAHQIRSSISFR